MPVHNTEIAGMFSRLAELLEIQGANPFRIRAYRKAAQAIEGLPHSVTSMLAEGSDLSDLPGIGKDLAAKIQEIVETGHLSLLDQVSSQLPGLLADLSGIHLLADRHFRGHQTIRVSQPTGVVSLPGRKTISYSHYPHYPVYFR